MNNTQRRHSDPLLPLWRRRIGWIAALGVFPSIAVPAVVLVLSFALAASTGPASTSTASTGTRSSPVDSGETAAEERPVPEQDEARPAPEAETTTTTDPGPDRAVVVAQLQKALAAAGFPNLIVALEGERVAESAVRVTGAVPDEAARRVALESVAEVATAAGLSRIIDNIVLGEQASASSLEVELSHTAAVVSGVVASETDLRPLLDGLGEIYRPEQIDTGGVQVDGRALELSFVDVTGQVSDTVLAERLTALLTAALSNVPSASVKVEAVERARVEVTLDEILAAAPLQFESASDRLTSSAEDTLLAVADALVAFPAAGLEVGGHTDSQGNEAANQDLSRRRAETVVGRLQELGVTNQLTATGYGELRPRVAPETTDADRSVNRRIEFRLV